MDEAAENFMDKWLDANVSRKHAEKPDEAVIKSLAERCTADATAKGVSLDKLEEVVCDIEEAIADEINVIAAQLAKQ